ncbi:MAG TPA: TetR/AcrR family transcriptional regulator [Aeriscardovia aeriphila]|uniref:TetR/AcrR family transcriptional regulator n=1 Tax=Aeriscardovia aeriphila TaxID=218139 RepID=A0A921FVT7_9BIFI|nr:TetR/AcrR family transcriptional regulator [Aeriscardovia aeriphila]
MSEIEHVNPLSARSRDMLRDALLSLLHDQTYKSISITDICRRATLSRQAFYNNYSSKSELLHDCIDEWMIRPLEGLALEQNVHVPALMLTYANVFLAHREFIAALTANGLVSALRKEMTGLVRATFGPHLPAGTDSRYSIIYLASGLTDALCRWALSENPIPERMALTMAVWLTPLLAKANPAHRE